MSFSFLDYNYDPAASQATFRYQGKDDIVFSEVVQFAPSTANYDAATLDSALFLAFVIIGSSYYKAAPTTTVNLPKDITSAQAEFFNKIYQEGLSQFAFENHLERSDLAHFVSSSVTSQPNHTFTEEKSLVLISGGKDSLLAAELIREKGLRFVPAYISAQESYPEIIDSLDSPLIIRRFIDKENLKNAGGLTGHVPITLINEAIALVQAILIGANTVELGIGREGLEPHAWISDLPVNHQWSKTTEAQDLLYQYIENNITPDIKIGSSLSALTELEIAKLFAEKCWEKYGHKFSSCNVANYKQDANNHTLKWCGKCAKCANSYLLFAPFVDYKEQEQIFGHDLFSDPELTETFKGLLNVDGVMKPFECVASYDELKYAYEHKLPGYGDLPFNI
jgi:hypothetical protein